MVVLTAKYRPPVETAGSAAKARDRLLGRLRARAAGHPQLSLYARVLIVNVSVLFVAGTILALSPATVSFPVAVEEAVVLGGGLAVMVIVSAALLRVSFGPLSWLLENMRTIDLLRPGHRLPIVGGPEVRALVTGLNGMLARLEEERRRSTRHALTAQDEERQRIGQELHDEIGQRLTGVLLQLESASSDAPASLATRHKLLEAREAIRTTLDEVGRLAWQLRPAILEDLGLTHALEALATSFEDQGIFRVRRELAGDLPRLSAEKELALYRVAQEALTNAAKHADADRVHLALMPSERGVRLVVSDNGRGLDRASFDSQESDAFGIRGMRERALLVGGELELESENGGGLCIFFDVPAAGRSVA